MGSDIGSSVGGGSVSGIWVPVGLGFFVGAGLVGIAVGFLARVAVASGPVSRFLLVGTAKVGVRLGVREGRGVVERRNSQYATGVPDGVGVPSLSRLESVQSPVRVGIAATPTSPPSSEDP